MRRALVLSSAVSLFAIACGSEERPKGVTPTPDTAVVDTGIPIFEIGTDTTVQPTDTNGVDTNSNDGTPADTAGDTTVTDSVITPMDTAFTPKDTSVGDVIKFEDGSITPTDSGVAMDVLGSIDTGGAADASPGSVPVGTTCATNTECDPAGSGVGICSNTAEAPDTIDPTPTCQSKGCVGGTASIGMTCGPSGTGLCVPGGLNGYCVDGCAFGGTGAATGCAGKTVCRVYSFKREGSGGTGLGSCGGGCASSADCTAGQQCQVEDGICVQTLVAYTKTIGQSCTSSSECRCEHGSGSGYCTRFCVTGGAACPTGYTCDPRLPKTDGTGTLFSTTPTGLAGDCLKNCANDADCSAYGGHCETNTATGVKVCRIP